MTEGHELEWLKKKADEEGISMSELGRRGGLKRAANAKRKLTHRHSDRLIQSMWWNN